MRCSGAAAAAILALGALVPLACAPGGVPPALAMDAFRAELARRAGPGEPVPVPFAVDEAAIAHARDQLQRAASGRARIERLVALLTREPPDGFGLRYRWSRTLAAEEALAEGEGNCLAFASVLVGLARGIGWRARYAEAGSPMEEELPEADFGVVADHMVVVLDAGGEGAVVDFLGPVEGRALRVLDDLQATAHFVNNRAFEAIALASREEGARPGWEAAAARFALATRIDPRSARAWNNLGVALARLGRSEEARDAYLRARHLDPALDSPARNLRVLRTRLAEGAEPVVEPLDAGR